jgi:hypothetical protein
LIAPPFINGRNGFIHQRHALVANENVIRKGQQRNNILFRFRAERAIERHLICPRRRPTRRMYRPNAPNLSSDARLRAGDWLIRPGVAFSGIFANGHGFTMALRSQMPLA